MSGEAAMGTGARKAGEFCWINVLTPNPAESKAWFSRVLGWTYADLGGMGDMIKVDGHQIGGLFDLNSPQTPPGTPPLIGVMVKTDDADATVAKANSLGGTAKPAFDIMDSGRMAEIKDPSGAQIDVWQPKKNDGTDADKSKHGAPSWYENYATDAAKAAKFYNELFGWTSEVMPMPGMEYTVFSFDGVQIAGMMGASEHTSGMPQIWATYFTVEDIDKTAALATELGGSLFVPPMDIPNVGRFAGIASPQGVKFFAMTYARQQ
ncbi:MAG TPA: VOC family protein [Gemmatimonadaceae bacterium]|nr:VOC family protein [Gemmatimonadaceae bacterium]